MISSRLVTHSGFSLTWRRWKLRGVVTCGGVALALGCSGTISTPSTSESSTEARPASDLAIIVARDSEEGNVLRGGRLYDNFHVENPSIGFAPDDAETPPLDGSGGPSNNGTLRDGDGNVLDNEQDHAYRVKNFFGWDLRGTEGVYGPSFQNKANVAPYNLLAPSLSRDELARLLVDGAEGIPAYGGVLPARDLVDLLAFVLAVREHELPQPSDIWELDADAPEGYVLRAGGRIAQGHAAIASSCTNCHGNDGTQLLFDDGEFSLGTLARSSAYEVWFKIVAGNPGTPMMSQIPIGEPVTTQAQWVLDVLAALCDRTRYPAGDASEPDVGGRDVRCGEYLR